jgi:hypothetical protein
MSEGEIKGGAIFKREKLMLKKKRKYKRKKERRREPAKYYRPNDTIDDDVKQSRTSASIMPYKSTVTSMIRVYGVHHPTRLTQNVLGSISIYGKSF